MIRPSNALHNARMTLVTGVRALHINSLEYLDYIAKQKMIKQLMLKGQTKGFIDPNPKPLRDADNDQPFQRVQKSLYPK